MRHRATSGRDLLSLDSTGPSCQEGSRLAKEHKASVPSGLLGIFSAKSPISPEQNPEVGRPGGGGGESCCSTAATPWCSVTGFCSPWHQNLCRKVLQASSAVRIIFLLPPPLPLILFSSYRTFLALYPLSILVASMQVPPRLPLSFLLGSGCLHCPLAFFHQRCFFHLHTSPFAAWAAPQACCCQARACEYGQLLVHPCCFFSDQTSPGSAVARGSVDMS